ncbi:MAG: DUF4286 family protein [Cytophagales bacterium]|nr:DUF4286 family protein [Cytophagales bacterium]
MILYNITYNIEKDIQKEWTSYMKNEYIPLFLQSGEIKSHKFLRLMKEDENEGETFALQFFGNSLEDIENCMVDLVHAINAQSERFGQKQVSFATLLEEI